jgi:hypothetical protein
VEPGRLAVDGRAVERAWRLAVDGGAVERLSEPGGGGYRLGLGPVESWPWPVAHSNGWSWMPPVSLPVPASSVFTAHGPRPTRLAAGSWRMGLENRIWVHMSYAQRVTDMDSLYPYP